MSRFKYRKAKIEDIPFLVDTIIEAEKSGTNVLTYSTIFGISEEDIRKYLSLILLEEIDGCELSVSSFLLAEDNDSIVGSVAAWVEGSEGLPSTILKGNLLKFVLPPDIMLRAITYNAMVSELYIECIPNSMQIGLVYVEKSRRGQNLATLMIEEQITRHSSNNNRLDAVYVQVFGNNIAAIKAYERAKFNKILEKVSSNKEILKFMPSDKKILMKREL